MINIFRDIVFTVANLKYLLLVTKSSEPSDINFRKEYSELTTIKKSKIGILETLYNISTRQNIKQFKFLLKKGKNNEKWFFINGILTTEDVAKINEKALESLLGVEFSTLYNPTNGFIIDIFESIFERTLNGYAHITKALYREITELLASGKKVKIIVHSQGGIILSNFLKLMKQTGKVCKNVEVYTFASAADEDVFVPGVYQEHFGNEYDFVNRIGLMRAFTVGDFYQRAGAYGHLLCRDYLEHFKEGKFCNGKSRLFSYLAKNCST